MKDGMVEEGGLREKAGGGKGRREDETGLMNE